MVAEVARADPAGCSKKLTQSDTTSAGLLEMSGTGSCAATLSTTLHGEIKQDISGGPDRYVNGNTNSATARSWYVHVGTCDGGRTAVYYARVYFQGQTDYLDGQHSTQHTCNY